jgi:hypothetical protein
MAEKFDLQQVVSRLEGLRTKLVYDSHRALRSLLFYHILPAFSSKNLFIAVFSDTMHRRLEKTYESIAKKSPEVAELIDKANVIKIGVRKETAFGKLYEFVTKESLWLGRLFGIMECLGEDDLVILYGFSLIPMMYGSKSIGSVLRLFDSLPVKLTLLVECPEESYNEEIARLTESLYDVVLRVERCDEPGFEGIYKIGVDQSIVDAVAGYARYKIEKDGWLVEL